MDNKESPTTSELIKLLSDSMAWSTKTGNTLPIASERLQALQDENGFLEECNANQLEQIKNLKAENEELEKENKGWENTYWKGSDRWERERKTQAQEISQLRAALEKGNKYFKIKSKWGCSKGDLEMWDVIKEALKETK